MTQIKFLGASSIDMRDAVFESLYEIASKDSSVVVLTDDQSALSLNKIKNYLKIQYFNIGIAEQNLISVGAGLALGGKKPFLYGISTFVTLRCYEQIVVDLCNMNLGCTIIGSGPGLTYAADGPTHHSIQDISIMRIMPNMTIFNPSDDFSASASTYLAYNCESPSYIRLEKGILPRIYSKSDDFSNGLSLLKSGKDLIIITSGIMTHRALEVSQELDKSSIDTGVIDIHRIKPINDNLLFSLICNTKRLVTLEEHLLDGGLGSAICELLADNGISLPVKRIGIGKRTSGHGDRTWFHTHYGLDINGVKKTILNWS